MKDPFFPYLNEIDRAIRYFTNNAVRLEIREKIDKGRKYQEIFFPAKKNEIISLSKNFFDFLTFNIFSVPLSSFSDVNFPQKPLIIIKEKPGQRDYSLININKKPDGTSSLNILKNLEKNLVPEKTWTKAINFYIDIFFVQKDSKGKERHLRKFDIVLDDDNIPARVVPLAVSEKEIPGVLEKILSKTIKPTKYINKFFSELGYNKNFHLEQINNFLQTYSNISNYCKKRGIYFFLDDQTFLGLPSGGFTVSVSFLKEIKDVYRIFHKIYFIMDLDIFIIKNS